MNTEYISMRADQMDRHQKVFTRWINLHLAKANPPVDVSDLTEEIKDGQILLTLVEVLLGVKVSRETKKNRISYIKNVQEAMRILARNKVRTAGVIGSEIVAGDQRATLSLIWSIILHFQVTEAIQPALTDYRVDKKLLAWCQDRLKGYKEQVSVSNLTSSWVDGLAFNALLHSFNPSLFDFDKISAHDREKRLTHALNLATASYGVPPLFESRDIGTETPDKNMITLFLSYLYQSVEKGASSVEIAWKEGSHSEVTRKEYKVETSSTRFESSRSGNATYDFKTFTTTQEGKNDGVFYDSSIKEAGQERVFNIQGFPADIQISERKAFVVSPFRKPTSSSSRSSSSASSPTFKDSETKEFMEEPLKFTSSPERSGKESYAYTVTTIQRSITTADGHVTSTQTTNTFSSEDSQNALSAKQALTGTQITIKGLEEKTGDDVKIIAQNRDGHEAEKKTTYTVEGTLQAAGAGAENIATTTDVTREQRTYKTVDSGGLSGS